MKKIVLKFWGLNVFTGILLYITYRIIIAQTDQPNAGFLESILQIIDILLNLAYSLVYLLAIIFFSFLIFLNLKENIRNKFFLSLLTFVGAPLLSIIILLITGLFHGGLKEVNAVRNLLNFSILYLFFNVLEFLIFRKVIKILSNQKI